MKNRSRIFTGKWFSIRKEAAFRSHCCLCLQFFCTTSKNPSSRRILPDSLKISMSADARLT